MRAFLEIARFELRYQARSPVFPALTFVAFAIHFCAARKWGLDIGMGPAADSTTLALNSTVAISQNEIWLSLFGILVGIALVATTITRDQERATAALFYTQPIKPFTYVSGRFAAGILLAITVGIAGMLGNLGSLLSPGIDPLLINRWSAAPWWYTLLVIVLPNTIIVSVLIFVAASKGRTMAAAFCVALVLPLLPIMGLPNYEEGGARWLAFADPFGIVALMDVTRYWTRPELIDNLPAGTLALNRVLWMFIALALLATTFASYRFRLSSLSGRNSRSQRSPAEERMTNDRYLTTMHREFGAWSNFNQFTSQLRMDLRAVLRSAPFYVVMFLGIVGCIDEFTAPSVTFNAPRLPETGRFVEFLDTGLFIPMMLAIAWFAGAVVHRERESGVSQVADAAPVPTVIPVMSKVTALYIMVALLLLAAIATFVLLQLAAGYRWIKPELYFLGGFRYGFNHFMLIVPAVLIQQVFQNRWLGMLLFLVAVVVSLSLTPLGFENLLYNFRLPATPYSDMNGFGHYAARDASLMAYWSAVIACLLIAAYLIAPRGQYDRVRQRIADARARLTLPTAGFGGVALACTVALGGWTYFNTHILNDYVTAATLQNQAVEYERKYRKDEEFWVPLATDLDLAVDLVPADRKLTSRGSIQLVNDSGAPITDLLVNMNPMLQVNALDVEGAILLEEDKALGVRRYRFVPALQPGATQVAKWNFTWNNQGFPNSITSNAILANGSYVEASQVVPIFGYRADLELRGEQERRREGLPPARRLASLDDTAARSDRSDRRYVPADIRTVISTSVDQLPVSQGELNREWTQDGRRYAEYEGRFPLALLAIASARYDVVRDKSLEDVAIDIDFDPMHRQAALWLARTARQGLEYYASQFGPYPLSSFRVLEYPRYGSSGSWLAGAVTNNEWGSFALIAEPGTTDIATAHNLAHMWWGSQIHSAPVQGRGVLEDALSLYSAYMFIEHEHGRAAVRSYLSFTRDLYLDAVSRDLESLPVARAESALNTYQKGSLVMYTLRDAVGAEVVNGALRRFLAKYGNRPPPYPTTSELIAELRVAVGARYQDLVTDLFEKVTFYDMRMTGASVRRVGDEYEVSLDVQAGKVHADVQGNETEAPLDAPVDIAVFGEEDDRVIYLAKHWLRTGTQHIVLKLEGEPGRVAVDPYGMMIERRSDDNTLEL
jgi:ABC-type transport system involved in multi-copper enzyme maturation permease subunit